MGRLLNLAIFDLDNTLLGGDSDNLWGQFLIARGVVDGQTYERENERFYQDYLAGILDPYAFLRFALRPLAENDPADLSAWREQFMHEYIQPIILPAARQLLALHRGRGDALLIITATNRFITAPIAEALGVEELLATEPAMRDGRFTGDVVGRPCFQAGKVEKLQAWLCEQLRSFQCKWFYSDSVNDVPLLGQVERPVAVDPDARLAATARERGWPVVSLRRETGEAVFARVG